MARAALVSFALPRTRLMIFQQAAGRYILELTGAIKCCKSDNIVGIGLVDLQTGRTMLMSVRPTILFVLVALMLSSTGRSADVAKGREAYNSGDYQTALAEWQPLAEEGYADAQFGMGLLNANGFGVPINDEEALKWYLLAADQGHAEAQCNLAVIHANGWGVPASDEEAFKWYSLAAEQGVTQAQTSLSKMYAGGRGVDQDKVQAHRWYAIALELGDVDAGFKRDQIAEKLSAEELLEADRLADAWIESHRNLLARD